MSTSIINAVAAIQVPYQGTLDPSAIPLDQALINDPDVEDLIDRIKPDFLYLANKAFSDLDATVLRLQELIYQEVENDQTRTPEYKQQQEQRIRANAVNAIEALHTNFEQRRTKIMAALDAAAASVAAGVLPKDVGQANVYLQQYAIIRDRFLRVLDAQDDAQSVLQRMIAFAKEVAGTGDRIALAVMQQEFPPYFEARNKGRITTSSGGDAVTSTLVQTLVPMLLPIERAVIQLKAALNFGYPMLMARYQQVIDLATKHGALWLDSYPGWAGNTVTIQRFYPGARS